MCCTVWEERKIPPASDQLQFPAPWELPGRGWKKTNALCPEKSFEEQRKPSKAVLWAPTFGKHTQRMKQAAFLSKGFSRTWLPLSWTGVDLQYCSESLHCAPWR